MLVEIHWHDMIISLPYIPPASVFNALVLTLPIYLSRFVVKSLITKVHDIQSSIKFMTVSIISFHVKIY